MTRARERPIPGVKRPPIPLRDAYHPKGKRNLNINPKLVQRMGADTAMWELAISECTLADERGDAFSLEHPEGSWG